MGYKGKLYGKVRGITFQLHIDTNDVEKLVIALKGITETSCVDDCQEIAEEALKKYNNKK